MDWDDNFNIKARIFSPIDEFNRISGTTGNDILVGMESPDLVWALAGDDELLGNGGNDALHGGQGSDDLDGGENDDELYGGVGDDFLFGGEGNDLLDGHGGDDQLIDLFGDNIFDSGRGNDLVVAGAGDDQFLFYATERGHDTAHGFGDGEDLVRLSGTRFADFEDVLAAGEDTAAGWRLQIDNDTSVTFFGITEAQLVAEDFILL